jgi:intein-encoded DNA endonuclease-like protein
MSNEEKAYIAGFLDGDGSIMAQLVARKGYRLGFQIRISIVFYQKTNHSDFLFWLKEQLGYGYVRNRPDGMTEYTIVGIREVESVLKLLLPFLHLKQELARLVISIIENYPPPRKMTAEILLALAQMVDKTAVYNYSKKRTRTSADVRQFLSENHLIAPVETDTCECRK